MTSRTHRSLVLGAALAAAACSAEKPRADSTAAAPMDSGPAAPPDIAMAASTVSDTLWLRAVDPTRDAIRATDDEAALIGRYGQTNVKRDSLPAAEGESVYGTVLFPQDSTRTLYVYWDDDAMFKHVGSVTTGPYASAWVVAPGVSVGTPMADVERLNGKPFDLFGFGWDYGGNVTNWHDGQLAKLWIHRKGADEDRDVMMRFRAADAPQSISGEDTFSSALPTMRAAKATVGELTVTTR